MFFGEMMRKTYQKFLERLARMQVKNPILTLLIIAAVTIVIMGGVSKVRTVASMEQMMPKNIDEITAFNSLRDNNMGQDMIAVVVSIDRESPYIDGIVDIRDKRVTEYIEQLKKNLVSEPDIREAYAVSDVINYALKQQGVKVDSLTELDVATYDALITNPQLQSRVSNFINDDSTISIIIATTDVSADDHRMNLLAERVISYVEHGGEPAGIKVQVTGTPLVQQKLGKLIAKDRKSTQWISTALVFIITMILFGTFTSALVPIVIVTVSVNWLYGIMGYANIPISTLAGGVAAMVIGIGIDYAIHLMNTFKNQRQKGRSIEDSLVKAVVNTGTALTGAAIATTVAFLAFLFGNMPEMNRFGLLMAIGVSSAFILSIVGLPALLVIEERIIHLITKKLHFGIEGEFMLYEEKDIHPDTHEVVDVDDEALRTLTKKYKIVAKKKSEGRGGTR